jgi:hypothetical protein
VEDEAKFASERMRETLLRDLHSTYKNKFQHFYIFWRFMHVPEVKICELKINRQLVAKKVLHPRILWVCSCLFDTM